MYGNFQRLDHMIERLPEEQTKASQELEAAQRQLEFARQEVTKEFPQEEELQTKQARLQALNIELSLDQPDTSAAVIEVADQEPAAEPVSVKRTVVARSRWNRLTMIFNKPDLGSHRRWTQKKRNCSEMEQFRSLYLDSTQRRGRYSVPGHLELTVIGGTVPQIEVY